jgi:hypothetical protein
VPPQRWQVSIAEERYETAPTKLQWRCRIGQSRRDAASLRDFAAFHGDSG